jgi:hypothetical protein
MKCRQFLMKLGLTFVRASRAVFSSRLRSLAVKPNDTANPSSGRQGQDRGFVDMSRLDAHRA